MGKSILNGDTRWLPIWIMATLWYTFLGICLLVGVAVVGALMFACYVMVGML